MEDVRNTTAAERMACTPQPIEEESKYEACTHVQVDDDLPPCIIFWDDRKWGDEARGDDSLSEVPELGAVVAVAGTVKRPRLSARARVVAGHTC